MNIVSKKIIQLLLLLLILIGNNGILGQNIEKVEISEIKKIFESLENGINSKSVKEFSSHLSPEVYISLEDGTNSYFSASQSYHILNDYLNQLDRISLTIIKKQSSSKKPFMVGQIRYNKSGVPANVQIFITLVKEAEVWQVSQIIIN